jgi:hypothetical protein
VVGLRHRLLILVKSSAGQCFDAPAVYARNKKRCCRNTARRRSENGHNRRILPILLVPGERIELPTNGLQNRCSTAELTRLEFTAISLARLPQAALAWSAV